jgi:long-subunit fatty acid transport protein
MNKNLFLDETGKTARTGFIATWDKSLTDKIWACIDYASGRNWYGSLSLGASYAFSPNLSLIVGYVVFNNDKIVPNNTLTTQLDINL